MASPASFLVSGILHVKKYNFMYLKNEPSDILIVFNYFMLFSK
jgi:hypothetical protein